MRILIHGINFYPEEAGVGKYSGEMADWLAAQGHEVRIVTAPPHFPQWRVPHGYSAWKYRRERRSVQDVFVRSSGDVLARKTEVEIFRCPIWVPQTPNGVKRLLHLASFGLSSWPAMLRQVAWRPDVVVLVEPTLFCSPQALFVACCSRATAWLHVQDFEVDAAFKLGDLSASRGRGWAFALERWLLHRFDRVSAISGRMVDRLMLKGVDSSRCVLFPNWVDTNVIHPLAGPSPFRRELGIAEGTVVALYSGSMGKKQGLDLLVDAARQLSPCLDLRLVFCGEGPYWHSIAEKSKALPNVSLLSFQPSGRLNDLLNLADIHLLPQRADAADLVMPSKLTGMLASGRPVVATAHRGTQLAAAVQGCGLVVPPGDLDAFSSAILQLTADRDLRLQLGQEARRYALAHLDSDMILGRFEEAMLGACDRSGVFMTNNQPQGGAGEAQPDSLRASFVERPGGLGAANTRKPYL
jgi:colanic acid biosynthesis glycosyl transferase WcaI